MLTSLTSTSLIALYFILEIYFSSGELTIVRGLSDGSSIHKNKQVKCISEDDGGALVWNYDQWLGSDIEGIKASPFVPNLRTKSVNDREVTLEWDPPSKTIGTVTEYVILWKVILLKGCQDHGKPTPYQEVSSTTKNTTTISLVDLHPYATYGVSVTACTTDRSDSSQIYFDTGYSDTPQGRLKEDSSIWAYPTDCTTITGPTNISKLVFNSSSDWVRNFNYTKESSTRSSKLGGFEQNFYEATRYKVRACVAKVLYAEAFMKNLYYYYKTSSWIVWGLGGKFNCSQSYYSLVPSSAKTPLYVALENFWESGHKRIGNQINALDAPTKVNATELENGIVKLTWSYPRQANGTSLKFKIHTKSVSTDLQNETEFKPGTMYREIEVSELKEISTNISNLLPSTWFKFCVSVNINGGQQCDDNWVEHFTRAALEFENNTLVDVKRTDSTIVIDLPSVKHDTRDSMMHVIVKGSTPCRPNSKLPEDLMEHTNVKEGQVSWRVASFSNGNRTRPFTIGDDKTYGEDWNCPLEPGETYEVVIVVQGGRKETENKTISISTPPIKLNAKSQGKFVFVWFAVLPILAIVALTVFFGYRKWKVMSKNSDTIYEVPLTSRLPDVSQRPCSQHTEYDDVQVMPQFSDPVEPSSLMGQSESSDYIYGSPKDNDYTHVVLVKYFELYVKRAFFGGMLEKQFEMFPKGQTKPWEYGSLPQNKPKNRYRNIIAYDKTRVKLRKRSGTPDSEPYSDYINASYINGYREERAYIATQGPLPNTVIDFWRMIWQEETLIICMLVNVTEAMKTKCEQYWPEIGTKKKYGEVDVWNVSQNVFADYTYRTFQVSVGQEMRQIQHLHYTAWPELDEPTHTYSVVAYLKKLLDTPRGNGPVVVHCSTGVGRTGTIILCDICLQGAAIDKGMYMFEEARTIRGRRVNMVANKEQYFLAHLAVAECLSAPSTAVTHCDGWSKKIKPLKKKLFVQRQRIIDTSWHDRMLQFTNINLPLSKRCLEKNRFPELAPGRANSVYISLYPLDDADSDYVAAVHVDGVTRKNQYLASQLPLPTTISDFWRLVAKLKIELVVILQEPNPNDTTCCEVMPQIDKIEPARHITVKAIKETDFEHFSSQELMLIDSSEAPARTHPITILKCKAWQSGKNNKPPSPDTLVSLWTASEEISRGESPTIVLCYDGVTGCGLYLALSFLLERMVVERVCDVYSAVRAVKRSRPQFVQTVDQFKYLYDAAMIYSECFETYTNLP